MNVLRYLAGTRALGIIYKPSATKSEITSFSDADFAGCCDSRKSTSGSLFLFSGGAISWSSKKQSLTTQSTVEAEFVSLSFAVREALWLHQLFKDTCKNTKTSFTICVDKQGCIALTKQDRLIERSKYIDMKFHFVKHHVQSGNLLLRYTSTKQMAADRFTKLLSKQKHISNVNLIGMSK